MPSKDGQAKIYPDPGTEKLDYRQLSMGFKEALAAFDEDGNGTVDVAEITKAARTFKDFANTNGTYSLASFPPDLQEELKVFDRDQDGTVSSEELGRVWASVALHCRVAFSNYSFLI